MLNEMSPYLLLGFLIAGILHVAMPTEKVVKHFGKNNFRSVVNAALLGVPLPLCSCGVIPTGLSFQKNGASKGASVSFLISTPQTGVDSIMATYAMLGLPLAILRPLIAFVTGIAGGLITNRMVKNEDAEVATTPYSVNVSEPKKNPVKEVFRYAFLEFMQDIAKWLIIGLVIAALISVLIPDDFFTAYLGNDYLSMLLVLLAAVPLYVCATGSIPIAAVLIMKGLSPGAAIVFLMAGPATNAATIGMIGKSMGRKTLIAYLGSIIGGAIFFGTLVNEFLPRDWMMTNMNHSVHDHKEMLPVWLQIGSSIVLSILLINALWQKHRQKITDNIVTANITNGMESKTVIVKGMTCNHCRLNVENNLKKIQGIKEISVSLENEQATIVADKIDLDLVKSTIEGLGYSYGGEK
jgi:uncharacterized membrane protein YraQ (UPF0718 family)/copper chaperone CopZ